MKIDPDLPAVIFPTGNHYIINNTERYNKINKKTKK